METEKKVSRLSLKIQILYGLGVSYAIVDQIFAQWVLYFYLPPSTSSLTPLLPPILISFALLIARFVDVIFEPIVGYLSDRFDSRWGRRIPFIFAGILPLSLSTVAYFYPVTGEGNLSTFLYLSVIGSLFFIFYTIVGGPYNALIPEISQDRRDRLNLSTWQSVFRLLYTAIAMILPGILIEVLGGGDDLQGIRYMVILLSTLALLGVWITSFSIDERKYSGGKISTEAFFPSIKLVLQSRPFVMYLFGFLFFFLGFNTLRASLNYYVEDIMGYSTAYITLASALLFGVSALCFYPINKLCKKIGYKTPMLISLVLLILLSLSLFAVGRILPEFFGFIIFALIGIPVAGAAFIFPPAMLSEISSVFSEKTGKNTEGLFFGLQGLFLKMAFLLSISLLPVLLVFGSDLSFFQSLTTTPEGVERIGVYSTSLFAAAAFCISFVFYFLYQEEFVTD